MSEPDVIAELSHELAEVHAAIRELRLADAHAARTGEEGRFDRAFSAVCQHENLIASLLARTGAAQ